MPMPTTSAAVPAGVDAACAVDAAAKIAAHDAIVNGFEAVYVERGGRVERADARFGSEGELLDAIERILAPLGRRVDEASPLCDARLPDRTVGQRQSDLPVAQR